MAIAKYREYLEQAISLDPGFALAYVDMADSVLMGSTTMSFAHEAMPQVRAQAQKALDLDPSLPEAQAMMGIVLGIYDYDWREAQRRFDLAMASDPVRRFSSVTDSFICSGSASRRRPRRRWRSDFEKIP